MIGFTGPLPRMLLNLSPSQHKPVRQAAVFSLVVFGLFFSLPGSAQERLSLSDEGWRVSGTLDPSTPEGQLAIAKRLFAGGEHKEAVKRANEWLEAFPNHHMAGEAYLLRGDARAASGDSYKALFDYEYVIRLYPGSEQFNTALEREYAIAISFYNGEKRKFWGINLLGANKEASEILIRIQERAPGTALAEQAMVSLADFYYNEGQMFLASETYDLLLLNYPQTTHKRYAMLRLILANLGQYKGPRYDVTTLLDASQWLQKFETEFPAASRELGADAFGQRIREAMARKQFDTAMWYIRQKEVVSAAYVLNRVVKEYPATAAALDAIKQLEVLGPVPGVQGVMEPEAAGLGA